MSNSATGWIGVDLDGTLAVYNGWQGEEHIGDPIPLMAARVARWLAAGQPVKIITARVSPNQGRATETIELITQKIQDWTEMYFGVRLEVTCQKDYGMIELWDDRCVQIEQNTGRRMDGRD